MVFAVAKTCFNGITVVSYAATVTVAAILTSSSEMVKEPAVAAVLATEISVTTAVVELGTVYKVVLVVVVAAPRNRTFDVVVGIYFS
jgi:hypothetical protein